MGREGGREMCRIVLGRERIEPSSRIGEEGDRVKFR